VKIKIKLQKWTKVNLREGKKSFNFNSVTKRNHDKTLIIEIKSFRIKATKFL